MKKYLFILAISVFTVSCSKDDDNNVVIPTPPVVTSETYQLTAYNTATPTDLNGDGTASVNQMTEINCFNANSVTIKSDNTFTAQQNGVYVETETTPATAVCYEIPAITGTYTIENGVITMNYIYEGVAQEQQYVMDDTSLRSTYTDDFIVSKDDTGAAVYITTELTIIYTKQ